MPKRSNKKKRPDINELAKAVVEQSTSDTTINNWDNEGGALPEEPVDPDKDPKAVKAGRLGGLKGGKARAKKLTAKQRSEAARKAALARWGSQGKV